MQWIVKDNSALLFYLKCREIWDNVSCKMLLFLELFLLICTRARRKVKSGQKESEKRMGLLGIVKCTLSCVEIAQYIFYVLTGILSSNMFAIDYKQNDMLRYLC